MKFKFDRKKFEDDLLIVSYFIEVFIKFVIELLKCVLIASLIVITFYHPHMFMPLWAMLLIVWLVSMFIKRYFVEVIDDD